MTKKRSGKIKLVIILIIIAAACAAGFFLWRHFFGNEESGSSSDVAYVDTVAVWTGQASSLGQFNRFAGVVESQESWSAPQNTDSQVKEILVKEGDEVKKGDPLYTYDMEKYQTDLEQAEIDLERQNNELESIKTTITQLTEEKKKASASEQANYTIQIQEQELSLKQKELDIKGKQNEIEKLKDNMKNGTVVSEIDGIVKSVNNQQTDSSDFLDAGGGSGAVVTIMRTGDLRVKGTVNEQNIGELYEGADVIVHSRVDASQTWHGVIDKIDIENNSQSEQDNMGMDYSSSGAGSTNKPFYVTLDSSEGLMMGQHVYMELNAGQDTQKQGIWLDDYLIDRSDEAHPFVWADSEGKLVKKEITLGEYDGELMKYEVTSGLSLTDSIAMPEERLEEGMKTAPMEQMVESETDDGGDVMEGDSDSPDGSGEFYGLDDAASPDDMMEGSPDDMMAGGPDDMMVGGPDDMMEAGPDDMMGAGADAALSGPGGAGGEWIGMLPAGVTEDRL